MTAFKANKKLSKKAKSKIKKRLLKGQVQIKMSEGI